MADRISPDQLAQTISILEKLISFESLPGRPTTDIITYIKELLETQGVTCELSFDNTGQRANLFATIGPDIDGGIVLNGHTDVVPVDGQQWSTPPFSLTRIQDRFYGRGSVDMKGFLACMLGGVSEFTAASLVKPVHLAFTFDEEIGGFGMPVLLKALADRRFGAVIVGEPTEEKIITGHKGGFEMRTEITGHEVHSCNPTLGVNAISAAVALINKIEAQGKRLADNPYQDSPYDPPYSTFNIGTIEGGMARNATAGSCHFNWELRPMPGEDGASIIADIETFAMEELLPKMRSVHPDSDIKIITEAPVPPLNNSNAEAATELVRKLTGINSTDVVSFGSDAGYFSEAGYSTVLYGPGSITRAHKPDEYIKESELVHGLEFMKKLAHHLSLT